MLGSIGGEMKIYTVLKQYIHDPKDLEVVAAFKTYEDAKSYMVDAKQLVDSKGKMFVDKLHKYTIQSTELR